MEAAVWADVLISSDVLLVGCLVAACSCSCSSLFTVFRTLRTCNDSRFYNITSVNSNTFGEEMQALLSAFLIKCPAF